MRPGVYVVRPSLGLLTAFTRRFLRAANLKLGYKLHDFPLKFFSHGNYQRRHRKSYFRRELRCRCNCYLRFLSKTQGAMQFLEKRMTGIENTFIDSVANVSKQSNIADGINDILCLLFSRLSLLIINYIVIIIC